MLIAMKETGVSSFRLYPIYAVLKLFGFWAWAENQRMKRDGYIKIIPTKCFEKIFAETEWNAFREMLHDARVSEPEIQDDGEYAKYGDSTKVPE